MDAMKTHLFFLFFVLVLAFLVGGIPEGGGSAWAQTVSSSRTMSLVKPSSAEDVGLLFYKVSGARPDFGLIIRQTRAYREMNATERMKVLESETGRLSAKFNSLDAKSSVIVIRAAVEMVLTLDPPNKKYTMDIKYPSTGTIFFPYEFSGRPIAVLADGIENFESVALNTQEALKASRHEGRRTATSRDPGSARLRREPAGRNPAGRDADLRRPAPEHQLVHPELSTTQATRPTRFPAAPEGAPA